MFSNRPRPVVNDKENEMNVENRESTAASADIEDTVMDNTIKVNRPVVTVTKRKRGSDKECEFTEDELNRGWREVLGNPPTYGETKVSCCLLTR